MLVSLIRARLVKVPVSESIAEGSKHRRCADDD